MGVLSSAVFVALWILFRLALSNSCFVELHKPPSVACDPVEPSFHCGRDHCYEYVHYGRDRYREYVHDCCEYDDFREYDH